MKPKNVFRTIVDRRCKSTNLIWCFVYEVPLENLEVVSENFKVQSNQCDVVTNISPAHCLTEDIAGVIVVRFFATRRPFSDVAIVSW